MTDFYKTMIPCSFQIMMNKYVVSHLFTLGTEIVTYCHIPEVIDMLKEQFYLQMKSFN